LLILARDVPQAAVVKHSGQQETEQSTGREGFQNLENTSPAVG